MHHRLDGDNPLAVHDLADAKVFGQRVGHHEQCVVERFIERQHIDFADDNGRTRCVCHRERAQRLQTLRLSIDNRLDPQ